MVKEAAKSFPPFRLDIINWCLWRARGDEDEQRIQMPPRAFAVLQLLVEHAGRVVTEDEFFAHVWPRVCVQPEGIKAQIYEIRKKLGDNPKNPRFIENLPRRGYRFIAPVADALAPRSPGESSSSTLVGRSRELASLRHCLKRTLENRRQVVFITGETGIGKTALADECIRRIEVEFSDVQIARAQCCEGHGGKEPYYAVLQAIGHLCRGSDGTRLVQTLGSQAPTWLVQFPGLTSRKEREVFQREILGATRGRMLREIGDALETFSSEKPLLLVFEDLHWADPSTVDFISALARGRGPGKLMLIATYRSADMGLAQHPLKSVKQDLLMHQLCDEIALEPLTEPQVAEYLAMKTAGEPVPLGLAAQLHRFTGGNPLFMAAAIDHLRIRGLIAVENGSWQVKEPLESIHMETPENLRQMIELQIDRLSAEEQQVLEMASINGISIPGSFKTSETTEDCETIERICEDLCRRQIMVRRRVSNQSSGGTPSQGYEIARTIYRDVFYRRQTPARRAKLAFHNSVRRDSVSPKVLTSCARTTFCLSSAIYDIR